MVKVKQVKFLERCADDNEHWTGGLLVTNENKRYLICGCCGSVFTEDEFVNVIIEPYDFWVSIDEEIMGD